MEKIQSLNMTNEMVAEDFMVLQQSEAYVCLMMTVGCPVSLLK